MKCFSLWLSALASIGGCIGLFIGLSGCAANLPKITLLESTRPDPLNEFLQYFHHAKSLDSPELHELYIQEEETFFYQNDPDSVIHLALLSLIQEPKLRTTSRSIDLLKTYLYENSADDKVHNFISFLHHILSQTRYRDHLYNKTKERLNTTLKERFNTALKERLNTALKERDQLAKRYERTKHQLDQSGVEKRKQKVQHKRVNRALHKEKQTVENLRNQIEQLKTIEKTLNKRKQERSPST